jgi:putative ABC transport system substrate-binding protein
MNIKFLKNKTTLFLVVALMLAIVIAGYLLLNPAKKVVHIGIVSGLNLFLGTEEGFISKMSELGYRDGENIVYNFQKTDNNMTEANEIIKNFVDNKVDLIFAFPTNAATIAKELTKNTAIPVVFSGATIEGSSLVKDVNYPGDNITGTRQATIETAIQRFELMHRIAPDAKKYLIFYKVNFSIIPSQIRELLSLAQDFGIQLILKPIDNTADISLYLQEQEKLENLDFDAILTIIEPVAVTPESSKMLASFADAYNIPFGGAPSTNNDYPNLFGVSVDNFVAGEQSAVIVDKILKGTFAGSIPVVTAEKYIQINLAVVKRLGLTIDDSVFSQADKIIR